MKYDLVVFDIAGTTVTDNGSINETFRNAFTAAGVEVPAADIDKVMGYRKVDAVKIIAGQYAAQEVMTEDWVNTVHDDFIQKMVAFYENDEDLKPLPYAEELFRLLQSKGIKVALNTGFTRTITDTILKRLGWQDTDMINAVICSDEVPEGRPEPYMIQRLMEELDVKDRERIVKVGDTEVDVLEGREAGCGLIVSVTTGSYTREQLNEYNPDFIIDSLNELSAIMEL